VKYSRLLATGEWRVECCGFKQMAARFYLYILSFGLCLPPTGAREKVVGYFKTHLHGAS